MAAIDSSDLTAGITRNAPAWVVGLLALAVTLYGYVRWDGLAATAMVGLLALLALGYAADNTRNYLRTKRIKRQNN